MNNYDQKGDKFIMVLLFAIPSTDCLQSEISPIKYTVGNSKNQNFEIRFIENIIKINNYPYM